MIQSEDKFVDTNMPEVLLQKLNELRINGQECDFRLYNDSVSFHTHKCLIRAMSPTIDRACQEVAGMKDYKMDYLSERGLETLVHYLYSGHLTLTGEICMEIHTAAIRLGITFIADSCVRYLKQHLNSTDCITHLQYSVEMGNEELKNVCIQFCVDNFEDLIHREDYMNIPPEAFCAIISSPDLYIREEIALFKAIRKWIDRDPDNRSCHAHQLSEHVRYQLLDVRSLLEILHSPANECFHDHIQKALMDLGMLAEQLAHQKWERKPNENRNQEPTQIGLPRGTSISSSPVSSHHTEGNYILAILGGRTQDKKLLRDIVCFRARKSSFSSGEETRDSSLPDRESLLTDPHSYFYLTPITHPNLQALPCPRKGFGAANVTNNVFLVGGMPTNAMHSVDVYVIPLEEWMVGPTMKAGRSWHGVTSTELIVYVTGGRDATGGVLSSCEMLDIRTDKWQCLPPMPKARMSLATCMLNTELYVACGVDETSVDCFDTVAGKWRAVAPLPVVHEASALLSCRGAIYLFGGMNASNFLQCVHRYDPVDNRWTQVASMPQPSAFHASVLLEDYAFVIGGRSSEGSLGVIQVYSVNQDQWRIQPQILPSARSSSCGIAIGLK
ncbi:unnamed protein product [Dicrocoelium dendriticum]|nr:unnamed protein product [Dicrocoelium dendriticum]